MNEDQLRAFSVVKLTDNQYEVTVATDAGTVTFVTTFATLYSIARYTDNELTRKAA